MREKGQGDYRIKPVHLGEVLANLREDASGVTHVTVADAEARHTYDKATFIESMG